jgi:hypothetical protein
MKGSNHHGKTAQYLQHWVLEMWDTATSDQVLEMLTKTSELADLEYEECSPKREEELLEELQNPDPADDSEGRCNDDSDIDDLKDKMRKARLAIWAVQVGALKAAIGKLSEHSVSINGLYDALGELSRGVSAETSFDVRDVSKIPRGDDLWSRALLIAAIEKYPSNRQNILKDAAKRLGIRSKQAAAIVNNYRSKTPANRLDLVRLVGLAKSMDDCGDIDILKEMTK